jgi:tripartite-type tricarboxylate transporter receptor subunit TctC
MMKSATMLSLAIAALPLCTLSFATAHAQTYPARPIRLIVPFPAGGTIDMVGRMVAQGVGERISQTMVVDNRGGAGGMLGADLVAKAAPDGYTLCLCSAALLLPVPNRRAAHPSNCARTSRRKYRAGRSY